MKFHRIAGLAAVALCLLAGATATAEVVITLKNGIKITVPVDREDIATIDLGGEAEKKKTSAKAVPPAAKPAPVPQKPAPAAKVAEKPKPVPSKPTEPVPAPPETVQPVDAKAKKGPKGLPGASGFKASAFAAQAPGPDGPSRVVRIGPGHEYERPSEFAPEARDGDVVEIEGAVYIDDFAVWNASYITLKGVNGRPHMKAEASPNNRKAIWVLAGDHVTVDNIEFSGAKVRDKNGGGIRYEGLYLTVRNSYFHHNQTGILTVSKPGMVVEIENSEFSHRIADSGRSHAIYIGKVRKLSVKNSYFHHNDVAHHIKTRAAENVILHNKIVDDDGASSYLIDLSNCGTTYVLGNVLQQSRKAENYTAIAYGPEGCAGQPKGLYVINNTFINDRHSGNFIKNHSPTPAVVTNNVVVGGGRLVSGAATEQGNIVGGGFRFRDRDSLDLHLMAGSKGIDAGVDPGRAGTFKLLPAHEYGYPGEPAVRKINGKIDAGAFEFHGN